MTQLQLRVNPTGIFDEYLRCLNICFPNWGDERAYNWYLGRNSPGYCSDQMILSDDSQILAGGMNTYRIAAFPNGQSARVGILGGCWTLPEARGQGCFTRIFEASRELCARRSCAYLMAFLLRDRTSFRQLVRAGALAIPSYYLFSTPATPEPDDAMPLAELEVDTSGAQELVERLRQEQQPFAHFAHTSADEFLTQFFYRPGPVHVSKAADGSIGFVEQIADTDRLQLLLPAPGPQKNWKRSISAYLGHAVAGSRKLFLFSMHEAVRKVCLELGMSVKDGYLTLLTIDETIVSKVQNAASVWDLQSGDRA